MSQRASSATIGAFVIVAVALAVTVLVLLGGGRFFHRLHLFVVYFRGSVSGLAAGAPVTFKGVEIGEVKQVYVMLSAARVESTEARIPVVIALDPSRIGRPGATALPPLDRFVDAGLRAQLATASFVTNHRYVALDIFPGAPKDLVADDQVPYPEIPTLPTALENAEVEAAELLAQLAKVDVAGAFGSAQRTLEGMDRLVHSRELDETLRSIQRGAASFESAMRNLDAASATVRRLGDAVAPDVATIAANTRATLDTATRVAGGTEALVASVRGLVEPAAPALLRLQQGLTEVAATARSLRHLVETVDRDPGILVRGGNP